MSSTINISDYICDIPPPSPKECLQIPICGPNDYPNVTALGSICSATFSVSTCLAGFMWYNPMNVSSKPPSVTTLTDNITMNWKLPTGNDSSQQCEERLYPFTRACCPGYYCPPAMYCMIPCDSEGSYCPSTDTSIYPNCYKSSVSSYVLQYKALMGCGGAYTYASSCTGGYSCTNSSTKQLCPRGYYCRDGSVEPFKCSLFMKCHPGSSLPGDSILAMILLGVLIFSILFLIQYQRNKKRALSMFYWCYKKCYGLDYEIVRRKKIQSKKRNVRTMFASDDEHRVPLIPETQCIEFKETETETELEEEEKHAGITLNNVSINQSIITDVSDTSTMASLRPSFGKMKAKEVSDKLKFFMDIEFRNMSLHLKANGKTILDNCSGMIPCGTVNAIMGPSGAGKTSFLFTLCGKAASYGKITGDILINGEQREIKDFKDIVGFVPQNDAMTATMTVKEMLEFNAKFRLSSECSEDYRKSVVRDVLKLLKIQKIRHSLIGDNVTRGISGGQQKRVNIGMELVSQPSVLFLDEPTSGLDSTTSSDVMDVLQLIAKRGTTVVVVLHQPRFEIFEAFDNVILLAEDGKMVYMAETSKSMQYFEQFGYKKQQMVNPADFLMDIISGSVHPIHAETIDFVEKWKNVDKTEFKMKANKHFAGDFIKDNSKYKPRKKLSFFHQTAMCTTRAVTTIFRQKWTMVSDIIMIAFIGFVAGFGIDSSSINKIPTNIYLTILSASIVGSIVSLKTFGNDRVMYWRFASSGINRLSYYIGSTIASSPWIVFKPLWFMMLYWPMAKPRGKVNVYAAMLVLGMFVVQGLSQLVSVVVDRNKAMLAAVVMVLMTNFFNGFEPTLPHLTGIAHYVSDIAYSRWQHDALWNKEINTWPEMFDSVKEYQHNYFGWRYDDEGFKIAVMNMVIIGSVIRILTFIALKYTNRAKQI